VRQSPIYNWDKLPVVLDTKTVALIYGVTTNTVKKWCYSGQLQGRKLGKKWVFEKNQIKEIFEKKND